MNSGFSLFQIERFLLGELSPAEQGEITRAAEGNPKLAAYIQRARVWTEESKQLKLPPSPVARKRGDWEWLAGMKNRLQGWVSAWERPAWAMPGLAMASVILVIGVFSITTFQGNPNNSVKTLSPKGGLGADMSIEHKTVSFTAGSDIAVSPGDTLRISYRSSDSLFFQLWNKDSHGEFSRLHQAEGESLPASAKWKHSGKSLVLDQGESPRQLVLIWAGSKSELFDLGKRLSDGGKIPEDKRAVFHIHSTKTQ